MGLLNSAMHIGRSALLGYQNALQVIGNNISSAGTEGYTRLTPELTPLQGSLLSGGVQPGAGVALSSIRRHVDQALEGRVRIANGGLESTMVQQSTLAQIESFFDNLSGAGVGSRLANFFHSFDDLQNNPEDPAMRDLAIASGVRLADSVKSLRGQLVQLSDDLDSQIAGIVKEADALAGQIAQLNSEIARAEGRAPGEATGLRDQRGILLHELGSFFEVTIRNQPDGSLNVYIGSETLVQGDRTRPLAAVEELVDGLTRTSARFADTNTQIQVKGGRLEGLLISRDEHSLAQLVSLDELAAAVIDEVNRIHADGQGMAGFTSVVGANPVLAADAVLSSVDAGLIDFPRNGSFFITTMDEATDTPVAHRIEVDLDGDGMDTTLESLVSDINAQVMGVTASITSDNRLALQAVPGMTFTFGHDGQDARADTSTVLAALGINTFFTGRDATDIAVNGVVMDDPNLLASSTVYLSGDGTAARTLADLEDATSRRLGGVSLLSSYNRIAGSVSVSAAGANEGRDASESIYLALRAQRETISGVSLDEEAISMLKFQRSFQGVSRFIRTVDQLLDELFALLR